MASSSPIDPTVVGGSSLSCAVSNRPSLPLASSIAPSQTVAAANPSPPPKASLSSAPPSVLPEPVARSALQSPPTVAPIPPTNGFSAQSPTNTVSMVIKSPTNAASVQWPSVDLVSSPNIASGSPSTLLSTQHALSLQVDGCFNEDDGCVGKSVRILTSHLNLDSTNCRKASVGMDDGVAHGSTQSKTALKGAWIKRLNLLPSTSDQPSVIPKVGSVMWPSLAASKSIPFQKVCAPHSPVEDNIRFPWAAKMNPASRNLYRATEPEYLEDGTPKVTIPKHVFLQGLENQKEYVLGQFYRCSPPSGGLIYAVFNKLWGRNCRITIRKLGDSNYLFHIPDESTRTWVLQRGLWHVDDCLMFVASWTPEASLAIPEIKTIPVWVTLKKIPNILYSIPGISHIASGLSAPMATYKPRLDPVLMGEAKILVEVELSKAFPSRIAADDENGFISMVDVEYAWLPSKCGRCGQLGHKVKRCLQAAIDSSIVAEITEIPLIDSSVIATSAPNFLPKTTQPNSTTAPISGNEVSSPNTLLGTNLVDPSDDTTTDDLVSLATIFVLENMVSEPAPTFVYINEVIESPISETAQFPTVSDTLIAQANSTAEGKSRRIAEPDYGSNKFASLISLEVDEDSSDSDIEMDLMDLMTPTGKRILRERPVKPSAKARDMHMQSTVRGRGTRGRGSRGGRG